MTREEALDFLTRAARIIAETFGSHCETVVQEVLRDEMVVMAIFNGHVSGRSVGSNIGVLGGTLDTSEMDIHDLAVDDVNLVTIHPSGKKIKSSNIMMRGEDYTYVLGINYDVTLLEDVQGMLGQFLTYSGDLYDTLSRSSGRTLHDLFNEAAREFPEIGGRLDKPRRLQLIARLNRKHFFALQKSVPFLAEKLNVSKYTLYKDLNELGIK